MAFAGSARITRGTARGDASASHNFALGQDFALSQDFSRGQDFALDALAARLAGQTRTQQAPRRPPPVEAWSPPFCGEIDMQITREGAWLYKGAPILRPALVRLFASILRKDPEGYVLVTPVERVRIAVEDAPFLAVEMNVEGKGSERILRFRTNVDDIVTADAAHPLRFDSAQADGFKPYVHVRRDLWALATRSLALDLAALGEIRSLDGARLFGVASAGIFFPVCAAQDLEAQKMPGHWRRGTGWGEGS
jgi:hypothetical protein